jgi:hypothetical protein
MVANLNFASGAPLQLRKSKMLVELTIGAVENAAPINIFPRFAHCGARRQAREHECEMQGRRENRRRNDSYKRGRPSFAQIFGMRLWMSCTRLKTQGIKSRQFY